MKRIRNKIENKEKKNNIKYPYLFTSYNKNYKTSYNLRNNNSHQKISNNKLNIKGNNTFILYNPDEEYVTKLNFFNIETKRSNIKKITLYNLNTVPQFPTIIKKDSENIESFKEKKRILNELKSRKTMFDKNNNSEGSKQTYVNRYENAFKENKLEKERKEIEKKIYKLKEMIKSLSNELSITLKEIDSLKLDVQIMQNYRSYNIFNNNINKKNENKNKENENVSKNVNNDDENLSPKKIRKSISKERDSITEKDKIKEKENKFKLEMMLITKGEKVNKIKQEKKEKLNELLEKKALLLEKIDICQNELSKFKENHNNLKDELLVHYHRLLSEGRDTRKDGLSWIILAIWNLKSNVLLSYMPKFLDQNIILFLFEYSSLLKTIKETEKKIQDLAIKLKENKEKVKNEIKHRRESIKFYEYNIKEPYEKINKKEEEEQNEKEQEKEDKSYYENEEDEDNESNENEEEIENDENNNEINNKELKKDDNNDNDNDNQKNNIILDKEKEGVEEKDEKKDKDIIEQINDIKNKNNIDNNQQTKFAETFKTSLYNTNSEKIDTKNNNLFFDKDNFKKGNNIKDNNFSKNKNDKEKTEEININNLPINFVKSLFRKEDLYKGNKIEEYKEKKIKLSDFNNIINKRPDYQVDYKTFELFNEHKNMEKYYLELKEKADSLMKKELDKVSKSFYLYDYGGKYNIDQKTVISALIGEDSVRNELNKQKKEEKEYFKTLRELRNGKISQKK